MSVNEKIHIFSDFYNWCVANDINFKWLTKDDIDSYIVGCHYEIADSLETGADYSEHVKVEDDIREFLLDILKDNICEKLN